MIKYPVKLKNYLMAEITRYTLIKAGFTISDPLLQDVMDKAFNLQKDLIKSGIPLNEILKIENKYLDKIDKINK